MKILLVNPNMTQAMTDRLAAVGHPARGAATPRTGSVGGSAQSRNFFLPLSTLTNCFGVEMPWRKPG